MSIAQQLYSEKWMMSKKDFYSFAKTVERLQEIRAGGLYGKIFGNPLMTSQTVSLPTATPDMSGDILIISVNGILAKGVSEEEAELLGMVNTDEIAEALKAAHLNPNIKCIYMWFNSPGGTTTGIEELGRLIKNINEEKKIYGWTETASASASYWLMSQCSKLGSTYSASTGSIGVYMLLLDLTEQLKTNGTKVNPIASGKYKLMGHEFKALTDEEQSILQKDVIKQHEKFKNTILATRPDVNPEAMEGLSYEGLDALDNGLVDIVCDSFDEFLMETLK